MQSFVGYIPVSTRFDLHLPLSLVPIGVGRALGRPLVWQRFIEVLTAEYEGRSLTSNVRSFYP